MFGLFRKRDALTANVIPWGGVEFDEDDLAPHYVATGMTGSGKTLTIRMLMRAVLAPGGHGLKSRAVIYDPKQDFLPLLVGMGVPESSIHVFHPFDARSIAWDIAKDVTDAAASRQFAEILAAEEDHSPQRFFINATIDVVSAVIDVFRTLRPGNWTLNDVVEATASLDHLRGVLSLNRGGRDVLQIYIESNTETGANVISSVRSKIARYETAARLSARAQKRVSLTDWLREDQPHIILLGTDDKNSATLDPINRAIFLRAAQLVCGRLDEYPEDRSWFFVDEARWAGKLEGLASLLIKGRSKGAHVVLGFQDILGMRAVYKEGVADELIGQCGNKAIMKLNSPETMAWASNCFQKYEEYTASFGSSSGAQGSSSNVNYNLNVRQAMMEQEFMNFPLPTKSEGIVGAFVTPHDIWQGKIEPKFIKRYLTEPANLPGFTPRDIKEQEPLHWQPDFLPSLRAAAERAGTTLPADQRSPAGRPPVAGNAGSSSLITMPHHK